MSLPDKLKAILSEAGVHEFSEAEKVLAQQLRELRQRGDLALGDDKNLTGAALEIRVFELFRLCNVDIKRGRSGKEDFVIATPEGADDIAIEVKSARSPNVKLVDLRQLDDWVFDLSGEEEARKGGLGGGLDSMSIATGGYRTPKSRNPDPHKGVLIFNGPVGTPFSDRQSHILLGENREFAMKRNFCVLSIDRLVALVGKAPTSVIDELLKSVGEFTGNR